jgi:uncharacterized membrane protein (DUF2068 family)
MLSLLSLCCLPTIMLPLQWKHQSGAGDAWAPKLLMAFSFALIPVASMGLWKDRKWGVHLFMLSCIALGSSLFTYAHNFELGLFCIHILLLLAILSVWIRKRIERKTRA